MFSVADLPKFSTSMKFEKSTGRRISEFTYEGSALKTVDEGIKTAMSFPAFFLRVINQEHKKVHKRPLVEDLPDVHRIMVSEAYTTMIHKAAFAPNAFWPGVFSDLPINTQDDHIWRSFFLFPDFIPDETSRLGFTLDTSPILEKLSENNQRGDSTLIPPHPVMDNLASSGCPVRLRRPQFTECEQDQARLVELSSVTGRTIKDLQSTRQFSGIQAGLDFGAGLLRRAVTLKQDNKISR
jgi:hypothetical protein